MPDASQRQLTSIEIYAPVAPLLPPKNTYFSSPTVVASTLPDPCPKALNLSAGVYNITLKAEKWRKSPLDSIFSSWNMSLSRRKSRMEQDAKMVQTAVVQLF